MITWMQRHKKWLVITIWISTIAFVGAGFVGWGSYQFNKTGGEVAQVGDTPVQMSDVQNQYNNLYNQYRSMFGENFNNEMAKELKLSDMAYENAISNAMILNFANELGLTATNEDVAKQLVQIKSFQNKDGKFDKETYVKVLGQNRTTPTEFEEGLKKDIIIQKVKDIAIHYSKPVQKELEDIQKILFSQDKLKIQIIDSKNLKVTFDETKIKKFWEENKNNYLSPTYLEVETSSFKIGSDEKASKKDALRKYLALKKGEATFEKKIKIDTSKPSMSAENLEIIQSSELGSVIKPFKENGEFVVAKLLRKVDPAPLSYKEAKSQVKKDFEMSEKSVLLEKTAHKALKNFKGKSIGYVSRESVDKIKGLTKDESVQFLNQLFLQTTKKGIVNVGSKSVVYEVLDSKLATYDAKKDQVIETTLNNMKVQATLNGLMKQLEQKYEVTRY
jgi:peptidyl-prolyl cis-trans isomerase D